jgi:hypothetical protein
MGSPNVDHEYQEPTEELNMLLLNTPNNIFNAFGTINWVTKKGWPQILKQQANEKSVTILNDSGSSDRPLGRKLFRTTLSPNFFNIKTLSTQQPTTITTVMNVNPFMAVIPTNVLHIQLLK